MAAEHIWSMLFGLAGGLGIFLLGMKNMSDGMQAVAGESLRVLIGKVTNNRIMAAGVGTLVTVIIQSSSITTVLVVGFVNSGMMTLTQAIGVIMGANIGTTITGWILVLKVGKYGLPLLGVAAFVYLFSKKDRLRYLAMAIMGIGMIFFGLELMKEACAGLQTLPQFAEWLKQFQADSFVGIVQCLFVGCVLTMMVQSSSAMLGITIALAETGAIPYPTAAALVLGENIGTTITALFASIGATTNARRAAYSHVMFNILGVVWISAIFLQYVEFIPWLANTVREMLGAGMLDVNRVVMDGGVAKYPDRTPLIAVTHSVFNIANTLLFLPFAHYFAVILKRFVPDLPHKEKPHLTSLDIRMLETPAIAIEQSRAEVLRMADGCRKMMDWLKHLLTTEPPDQGLVRKLFHREEVLDAIQDEVTAFMTDLLAGNLTHDVIREGRRQLRMADEYESVSDYISNILKFRLKLRDQGHALDEQHLEDLLPLHDEVAEYLRLITAGYELRNPDTITKAHSLGSGIKHRVKTLRNRHLDALTVEKVEPHINVAYMAMLNSYRRVRDHVLNIAEAIAGEK